MSTSDRRIERIKQYVETNLGYLPPEKELNDDADDMVNDAIRETLEEVQGLLTGPLGKTFAEIHIDGQGMRQVSIYRLFFKAALRAVRKRQADYDAEVKDWYENGDGRPRSEGGQGYTFPYCIHGVSRWVDYDCACGWCEDSSTTVDLARLEARTNFLRFVEHWEWVMAAPNTISDEVRRDLHAQLTSLFPRLDTVSGD